jgi:hypothetical protein
MSSKGITLETPADLSAFMNAMAFEVIDLAFGRAHCGMTRFMIYQGQGWRISMDLDEDVEPPEAYPFHPNEKDPKEPLLFETLNGLVWELSRLHAAHTPIPSRLSKLLHKVASIMADEKKDYHIIPDEDGGL